MPEEAPDASELESAKSKLAAAEKVEHEKLIPKLKCGEGHLTDIPADLQAKMDADEDLGDLPPCGTCGGATQISVATE